MSMANPQDGAAAEAGDRSPHLVRRVPADGSEAHARRDLDDGSSRRLPRARADESEGRDRGDVDAADPSPFRTLRRAPAKKAEAHDRWDADSGDPSSHFLSRAPADVDDGSSNLPPPADVDERDYREDEDGDPSSSPAKNAEGYNHGEPIDPSSSILPADGNRLRQPRNLQVTTSSTGLGPDYIDPHHIYELYLGGQLNSLLEYMDYFPGAVDDFHYRMIKELVYISMGRDLPDHLKIEWNVRRAEAARDLAFRIDQRLARFKEPLTSTQDPVPICSAETYLSHSNNMSVHATTSKNSYEGQIFQKIPVGSGFSGQVPKIEGINPLRFGSKHPVWGVHALAVEENKDTKVASFFCLYCDKKFAGNAQHAIKHMKAGCKIPLNTLNSLLKEVEQYQERVEQLRSAKKGSKIRGRKAIAANGGMEIVQKSDVSKIRELILELSQREQYGPLDDIRGVLAMSQSLLMQARKHLQDETEPITIAEWYEMAARIACDHLEHISETLIFSAIDKETLVNTCMAALSKDIVNRRELANAAVEAVLRVVDWERKNVNLELIQLKGKVGRKQTAELVQGTFIDKKMSHQQMPKRIEGAKVALLSFESNIDRVEASRILHDQLEEMIRKCQEIGATLVICQWNFDDKASHLLMQRKLAAVRGVSDAELKEISSATGGQAVQKIQDLSRDKLGEAKLVREKKIGKTKDQVLYIESYASPGPVTIFVRAGSNIVLEETMKKLADSLCVLRSLVVNDTFVCGGGSAEISCSLAVDTAADASPGYARPFLKSFAYALGAIPLAAVSENSGLLPFDILTMLKSRHVEEKNAYLGIDCSGCGIKDMKEQRIFASVIGKKKQILLALEVLKSMLKMHDVT